MADLRAGVITYGNKSIRERGIEAQCQSVLLKRQDLNNHLQTDPFLQWGSIGTQADSREFTRVRIVTISSKEEKHG